MNIITEWLMSADKNYTAGVQLYAQFDSKKEFLPFFSKFSTGKSGDNQFNILYRQLQRLERIVASQPEIINNTAIKSVPILIDKVVTNGIRSKQLTNKLLSMSWEDFDERDKAYFKNDLQLFVTKKNSLIEISRLDNEMKNLHANIKTSTDDEKRQEIAERILAIDNLKLNLWKSIDDFDTISNPKSDLPKTTVADLYKEKSNLRSNISKEKKKIVYENDKAKYESRSKKLVEMQTRLDEIEKLLNE